MSFNRRIAPAAVLALLAGLWGAIGPAQANNARRFPQVRPSTRAEAVWAIRGAEAGRSCLTPEIQLALRETSEITPAIRRALELLRQRAGYPAERSVDGPDGIRIRYAPSLFGGEATDIVQATLQGLAQARRLLVEQLELPAPESFDVLLVELGGRLDGYHVPRTRTARPAAVVLDASRRVGPDHVRRAAIHQYAHAVSLAGGASFPAEWSEALATWATLRLDGLDAETAAQIDYRIRHLHQGLLDPDLKLAPGNALWFSFLEEAYDTSAVRMTVAELAREGAAAPTALDLGLRRAAADDLASAFREFHLWTLFVGTRSDGEHFSFAEHLEPPVFSSTAGSLPALSVQSDPAVAPLGAAQIQIRPRGAEGGLRIDIEGDFSARWEADLLLVGEDGSRHRVPLPLTSDGRGERIVPADGLSEAVVLLRSLGSDDSGAHRYTYAARAEEGFPYRIASFEAARLPGVDAGVLVEWETSSEQRLVGFNLLRTREDGGPVVTVNPIWIPALGGGDRATAYRFVDPEADPRAAYSYRIQGITVDGLTSASEAVTVPASN